MKHLILILTILSAHVVKGQELSLNESINFYEYSHVKETDNENINNKFVERLKAINYKEIQSTETSLSAKGFSNHLVGGFATVEINYLCKIQFREGRYKLTLTNFILTDKNGSNPLEGMGGFKKKWIKIINSKLPEIVTNIERLEGNEDW